MKNALLAAALGYAGRGWAVFPLEAGGKQPIAGTHGHKDATDDPARIRKWWATRPYNIGVALDASGLAVLDIDGPSGRDELARLERKYGALPPTLEATSGRPHRKQLWFTNETGLTGRHVHVHDVALDVLAGGYVLVEPSIHPKTGEPYFFTNNLPLAPLPDWVARVVEKRAKRSGPAAPVLGPIAEGARNDTLTSLAGTMRRRGFGPDSIRAALRIENAERCQPPMDETEVDRIAASVSRYAPLPFDLNGPINESTLADRFAALERDALRYCPQSRTWLVWDGTRWAQDDLLEVDRRVESMVRGLLGLLEGVEDPEARGKLFRVVNPYTRRRNLDDLKVHASRHKDLIVPIGELDADPWLLNVENGTIDLRTGRLRDHRPTDQITLLAPVTYDPKAQCPEWHGFLHVVLRKSAAIDWDEPLGTAEADDKLEAYLQELFGVSLTGIVTDDVFPLAYGDGGSDKTTAQNALQAILGDYAVTIDFGLLLTKQWDATNADHRVPAAPLPRARRLRV